MGPSYEEVKDELIRIASILEKYPDSIKPQVYELLIKQYLGNEVMQSGTKTLISKELEKEPTVRKSTEANANTKTRSRSPSSSVTIGIDGNLDLLGDGKNTPSFRVFCDQKLPNKGNQSEFITVCVYYLSKILNLNPVTYNHVYTCYAEVKRRPNDNFEATFTNTRNRTKWIELKGKGEVDITLRGINFVEHDLPPGSVSAK